MADDQKSTVTIDIVGDAEAFRQSLKEASSDTAEFLKDIKKQNKSLLKEDRTIAAVEKAMRSSSKKDRTAAIQHEKNLARVLKQKANTLKELSKQGKRDSVEAKKLREELKEQANLYAEIKTNREKEDKNTFFGKNKGGMKQSAKNIGMGVAGGLAAVGFAALSFFKDSILGGLDTVDDLRKEQRDAAKIGGQEFRDKIETQVPGMESFGADRIEVTRQASSIAKLTGKLDDVLESNKMSFLSGMSQEQQSQFMGTLARGGITSDNGASEREQIKIVSAGFASGIKKARLHEVFEGISQLLETAQQKTSGDVSTDPYTNIYGMLSKFSGGKSGLQGVRGLSTIQKLEAGISGADKNSAQAAFVRQAYGYGIPGGSTDFYSAEKTRQLGFTGQGGDKRLEKILEKTLSQYGNNEAGYIGLSELTGGQLNYDQSESILKAFVASQKAGDSSSFKDQFEKLSEELKSPDQRIEQILSDKIFTVLRENVNATNKIMTSTEPLADFINSYKQPLREMAATVIGELPKLVKGFKDFADEMIKFTDEVREFFSFGEKTAEKGLVGVDGSTMPKTGIVQDKVFDDLVEATRKKATGEAPLIKDLPKMPRINNSPLEEQLPSLSPQSLVPSQESRVSFDPIKVETTVQLINPDGTKQGSPITLENVVRPAPTKIVTGRGD